MNIHQREQSSSYDKAHLRGGGQTSKEELSPIDMTSMFGELLRMVREYLISSFHFLSNNKHSLLHSSYTTITTHHTKGLASSLRDVLLQRQIRISTHSLRSLLKFVSPFQKFPMKMCGCGLFHQFPTGLLTSLEGSGTPRQWRAPLDGSAILLQSLCYHNLCVIGRGVIVVSDYCAFTVFRSY